uniref:Uncharacterized protein n=2 Tax=gambiae species complex TaxID=44542 RepID=A0ABK8G2X7_ANOGA
MKLYVQMMLLALIALVAFVGAREMPVTEKVDPPPFEPDGYIHPTDYGI